MRYNLQNTEERTCYFHQYVCGSRSIVVLCCTSIDTVTFQRLSVLISVESVDYAVCFSCFDGIANDMETI